MTSLASATSTPPTKQRTAVATITAGSAFDIVWFVNHIDGCGVIEGADDVAASAAVADQTRRCRHCRHWRHCRRCPNKEAAVAAVAGSVVRFGSASIPLPMDRAAWADERLLTIRTDECSG